MLRSGVQTCCVWLKIAEATVAIPADRRIMHAFNRRGHEDAMRRTVSALNAPIGINLPNGHVTPDTACQGRHGRNSDNSHQHPAEATEKVPARGNRFAGGNTFYLSRFQSCPPRPAPFPLRHHDPYSQPVHGGWPVHVATPFRRLSRLPRVATAARAPIPATRMARARSWRKVRRDQVA